MFGSIRRLCVTDPKFDFRFVVGLARVDFFNFFVHRVEFHWLPTVSFRFFPRDPNNVGTDDFNDHGFRLGISGGVGVLVGHF